MSRDHVDGDEPMPPPPNPVVAATLELCARCAREGRFMTDAERRDLIVLHAESFEHLAELLATIPADPEYPNLTPERVANLAAKLRRVLLRPISGGQT